MTVSRRLLAADRLLSHHFHNYPLAALAVELGIKNALPSAEIELARGDGQDNLVVDEQGLEVRVAIAFAGLMMAVVFSKGRQALQPLVYVLNEAGFVVVHVYGRSYMHGRDQ